MKLFRRNKPVHFIRVEFDGYADFTFICKAKPDAPCRMVCPRECESCDHPRTRQVPYCNPGEFINNADDGVISQAGLQPPLILPVDTRWNGDTYVWGVRQS